jgi:hypothetical protein
MWNVKFPGFFFIISDLTWWCVEEKIPEKNAIKMRKWRSLSYHNWRDAARLNNINIRFLRCFDRFIIMIYWLIFLSHTLLTCTASLTSTSRQHNRTQNNQKNGNIFYRHAFNFQDYLPTLFTLLFIFIIHSKCRRFKVNYTTIPLSLHF